MGMVQSVLDRGFSKRGEQWDSSPWRRFVLVWLCPVCAVVIAVAGVFIMRERLTAGFDCRLTLEHMFDIM